LHTPQLSDLQVRDTRQGVDFKTKIAIPFDNEKRFLELLMKGFNARVTGATKANGRSSRSHLIIMIKMKRIEPDKTKINSLLNLVDLAGAERLEQSGADKDADPIRLKEAKAINYGLSQLGNVMNALVKKMDDPSKFVPYKNSKLTRLLRNGLSSNCATTLCCNISAISTEMK